MKRLLLGIVLAVLLFFSLSQVSVVVPVMYGSENVKYNESALAEHCHEDCSVTACETASSGDYKEDDRACSESLAPTTEWNKTFGGTRNDTSWSVVQTPDGGYLVVGDTCSYGSGIIDAWLVKTDRDGNIEDGWPKTYGDSLGDRARSVARTFDGGYVIAGYTDSYGAGIDDFWLIKVNASGHKEWDQTFGGTAVDRAYAVLQRVDGGYVLVGHTKSVGEGKEDVFLVKIGDDGQESWNWYGGSNSDMGRCVVQTSDGGFAIAGSTNSFGAGSHDFYLIKTNPNGGWEWSKWYGGTGEDQAYSIVQTIDGGYLLAGDTKSDGTDHYDIMLVKTDCDGNIENGWPKTYGGPGDDTAWSVIQTYDGGYLVVGDTTSYGAGQEDFWLVKTDSSGIEQWTRTYGDTGSDMASSVQQTGDGGYIVAGRTNSYGEGENDFWLIKLSSESDTADLNVLPRMQRKDTMMLCLGGCPLEGIHAWDVQHRGDWSHNCPHCNMSCSRAAISMINSYYGGYLSQDRISYYYFEELHGDGLPEGDLGCGRGMPQEDALEWALNGASVEHRSGKPPFSDIKYWIDSGRPILRRHVHSEGAHATVIDGYEVTNQNVHVIDPWTGTESSEAYSDLNVIEVWIPPTPGPSVAARSDEDWNINGIPDTIEDYDRDGVCDFDEIYRFFTKQDNSDSDGDGVPDKAEIISYTFLSDGNFDAADLRRPDPDGDNYRCELDNDSDNGGVRDGSEDKNGNGFVDLGETDPLDPYDDPNAVIHLMSREDNNASSDLGSIVFEDSTYSLPNNITKIAATYPIRYINADPSYVFDHWETTPEITVGDPNAENTTAAISSDGNLTAIYKVAFVHGYSMVKVHYVLGGQASMSFGISGSSTLISLCLGWTFSFLKGKHKCRNKILLICTVVSGFLLIVGTYALYQHYSIQSTGTISFSPKIVVYLDSECTNNASFLDWGPMLPGSTNNITSYMRNEGGPPITLSMNASNWAPSEISDYVNLSWDYNGEQLNPSDIAEVVFTLNLSESIGHTDIETFIFDIIICVHESV